MNKRKIANSIVSGLANYAGSVIIGSLVIEATKNSHPVVKTAGIVGSFALSMVLGAKINKLSMEYIDDVVDAVTIPQE